MTASFRPWSLVVATLTLLAAAPAPLASGQPSVTRTDRPELAPRSGILSKVKFEQKPGAQVPLDLRFRDESGRVVRLGDLLGDKPVILTLVYFDCPLLCNQILDGLTRSLNVLDDYTVGSEFEIISVSINPKDVPESAIAKEAAVMRAYHFASEEARDGWHFLTTDDSDTIDALADSVGFSYSFNPKTNLYAHAAGIITLTPDGRVSRYVYGISYPARDLRLALSEASGGKIGGVVEQALLLCYAYDPESGTYSFAIMNVVRLLGVATLVGLAWFITAMLIRDRRRAMSPAGQIEKTPDAHLDR
ncbi:SCO family protein [Tautonia sociabilis]|uniref:SCO family protein n=1 Tax=Tautonia sociabilis TaxID=2080755 RepID=A0A432MQ58_9BACT|nr:SCO family protein [Tautonia sociabilis]RUL89572.1 SCO family protein [Tautonia sociabilis]